MPAVKEAFGNVELNLDLRHAAGDGDVEKIKALLKAGANIHANYDAALREAAYFGKREAVRVLLAAGADPHSLDGSALNAAKRNNHRDTAQILSEAMLRRK